MTTQHKTNPNPNPNPLNPAWYRCRFIHMYTIVTAPQEIWASFIHFSSFQFHGADVSCFHSKDVPTSSFNAHSANAKEVIDVVGTASGVFTTYESPYHTLRSTPTFYSILTACLNCTHQTVSLGLY